MKKIFILCAFMLIFIQGINADAAGTITIENSKTQIKAGKSYTFKAVSDTGEGISWSVSDTNKAQITKEGRFTAKKVGKVTVNALCGDISKSIKVTIKPKKIVAIDAGHQAKGDGSTETIGPGSSVKKAKVASGTSGFATKVPEYKLTLAVAKKLKKELVNRGYKVVMIRKSNDVNISNKERAIKANETSDICIRLHADGIGNSSVAGASALYPSKSNKYVGKLSGKCKKLSEAVLSGMCSKSGAKKRGLSQRDDLTGTNWSTIPVTLIEMGFMTNPQEDRNMQNSDYQKKLAEGMAEGVEKYFGCKN